MLEISESNLTERKNLMSFDKVSSRVLNKLIQGYSRLEQGSECCKLKLIGIHSDHRPA